MADHKEIGCEDRDYLLPQPHPSKSSFTMRPCPNSTALRWFRSVLNDCQVDDEAILKVTLASLRVTVPDLAYSCGVPGHLRIFLGRWTTESMADRYTREHLNACQGVCQTVRQRLDRDTDFGSSTDQFPVELGGEGYGVPAIEEELIVDRSMASQVDVSPPAGDTDAKRPRVEVAHLSPQLEPAAPAALAWDTRLAKDFADSQATEDNPVPLVINSASGKVHIAAKTEGSIVWDITQGCSWTFSQASVEMVPPEVLALGGKTLCKPCFRAIRNGVLEDPLPVYLSDASVDDLSSVGSSDSDAAAFEEAGAT